MKWYIKIFLDEFETANTTRHHRLPSPRRIERAGAYRGHDVVSFTLRVEYGIYPSNVKIRREKTFVFNRPPTWEDLLSLQP
jgi:hypothetical protein